MSNELDLKFIDSVDLWNELSSRYDAAVFVGFCDHTEDAARVAMMYRGDQFRCEGLAREFARRISGVSQVCEE